MKPQMNTDRKEGLEARDWPGGFRLVSSPYSLASALHLWLLCPILQRDQRDRAQPVSDPDEGAQLADDGQRDAGAACEANRFQGQRVAALVNAGPRRHEEERAVD